MRLFKHSPVFLLGLIIPLFFSYQWGTPLNPAHKKIITQFLHTINSNMPGTNIKCDPNNASVSDIGNNRYRITLRKSTLQTNLAKIIPILTKVSGNNSNTIPPTDSAQLEEMVVFFGPLDNYMHLHSMKGMSIENNAIEHPAQNQNPAPGDLAIKKIKAYIGSILFPPDSRNTNTRPGETIIENLTVTITEKNTHGDTISIKINIEKVGSADHGKNDGSFSQDIMVSNLPPIELKDALEKGIAINDLTVQLGKINITIHKNGKPICTGYIQSGIYRQFFKPNTTRQNFMTGIGIEIKNLNLTIPNDKPTQWLTRINHLNILQSTTNINLAAAQAFKDFLNASVKAGAIIGNQTDGEILAQIAKMAQAFMQSQVQIKFAINPFNHYFGNMNAEVNINLGNVIVGPFATLTLNFYQVEAILKKLRDSKVFSDAEVNAISAYLYKNATKREKGNLSIINSLGVQEFYKLISPTSPVKPPIVKTPPASKKTSKK